MKKDIIAKIILTVGCLFIILGTAITINKYYLENNNQEENIDSCTYAIQNGKFEKITLDHENITFKINFLDCIEEIESNETEKNYQSKDETYAINLTFIEKSAENYYDELLSLYEEEKPNNQITTETEITFNGFIFYIISVKENNTANVITKQEYNIISTIEDDSCILVKITYNQGEMEAGFLTAIIDSIEIINPQRSEYSN